MEHRSFLRWLGLAAALATGAVAAQALPGVRAVPKPAAPAATGMSGASAAGPNTTLTPGSSGLRSGFAPAPTQVLGNSGGMRRNYASAEGASPWSPAELARSFGQADANRDGTLSAREAEQLVIRPSSFEEMDADHDERLTPREYQDAAAR
jgi:hypothetical protein